MDDVVRAIRADRVKYRKFDIPDEFDVTSKRAVMLFKHALIFDPETDSIQHCSQPPDDVELIATEGGSESWIGRVPTSEEEAINIATSVIDPDTLEPYSTGVSSTAAPAAPAPARRRGARIRGTWCRGERRRGNVSALELNSAQWAALCKQHHIDYRVNQKTIIPQAVQVALLAPTESDVKNGAGLFSNYRRSPSETLTYFRRARRLPTPPWKRDDLEGFCSTRPLSLYDSNKRKLTVDRLLDRIERQLETEAEFGRYGQVVCPNNSQLPANRRLATLKTAGIINEKNCPRLVPLPFPPQNDPDWEFCDPSKHLAEMAFPFIGTQYLEGFSSNWGAMYKKGSECFWQGRAYAFRWKDAGDFRFFKFKTKRTMKRGLMEVHINNNIFFLILLSRYHLTITCTVKIVNLHTHL